MSAIKAAAPRPFDVLVWGASGFTGQLVCRHLAQSYGYGRDVKWAMAGRDVKKLEQIRKGITKYNADCAGVPILVADAHDPQSLGSVLSQTKVVLAMVGPFSMHGSSVVEQAVEQGTHYCDITGEINWVKQMYQKHDAEAKAKGVKIVHCCGFDSIPSDLGTLMMVDHIRKVYGKATAKVYGLLGGFSGGGFSGGTVASAQAIASKSPMSELKEMMNNAYYLASMVGGPGSKGSSKPAPKSPVFIEEANTWAGPFIMEGTNARIVHMSNALAPTPYGKDFSYEEMAATGTGFRGWVGACVAGIILAFAGAVISLPPLIYLSKWFLPAPGQGPSETAMTSASWSFEFTAIAEEDESENKAAAAPIVIKGRCGDKNRDGGYWSTSRLILETGLCLAREEEGTRSGGGVMTPAAAAGLALIERLKKAGYDWEVLPLEVPSTAALAAAAAAGGEARPASQSVTRL